MKCEYSMSLLKFTDSVLSGGLVSYDLNCFYFNTRTYLHTYREYNQGQRFECVQDKRQGVEY